MADERNESQQRIEDDVEGHRARHLEDDVEGHAKRRSDDDDVEGHLLLNSLQGNQLLEDDVEGHRK